jgi:hypothetical protein
MIRNADAILMVIDLSDDVIPQLEKLNYARLWGGRQLSGTAGAEGFHY